MEESASDLVCAIVLITTSRVPNVNLVCIINVNKPITTSSFLDKSVCDPSKLNFNGGYNCTGTQSTFTCSLVCPDGAPFSFQPESSYTCSYSEGDFKPKLTPQCVVGNGVMIKSKRHSIISYSKMDLMSMNWYLILNGIYNTK